MTKHLQTSQVVQEFQSARVLCALVALCTILTGCGPSPHLSGGCGLQLTAPATIVSVRPRGSGVFVLWMEDGAAIQADSLVIVLKGKDNVPITAGALPGWKFERWDGDVIDPSSQRTELKVVPDGRAVCVFSARDADK